MGESEIILSQNKTMERTYIMIKPDGVQRGLIGRIISRFEDRGYRLAGLKMLHAQDETLEEHYAELKDRPFFPGLMEYTNPSNAAPGTIRGDFAIIPGRNVVHGSD